MMKTLMTACAVVIVLLIFTVVDMDDKECRSKGGVLVKRASAIWYECVELETK